MRLQRLAASGLLLCALTAMAQTGTTPSSAQPLVLSTAFIDMSGCKRPDYPEGSLAANESGTTQLRYVVDIDHSLREVQIDRSSGWPRLDQAAIDAFSRCKGVPASVNGTAVAAYGRTVVNWRPGMQAEVGTRSASCRPTYPEEAIKQELQGTSKLRFSISERGSVTSVAVVSSSGSDLLDAAAISGLATCRFKVSLDANGNPIVSSIVVDYVWKLN